MFEMKIAYIYLAFINIGGADKIIISKANYMADHWGWEVYRAHPAAHRPAVSPWTGRAILLQTARMACWFAMATQPTWPTRYAR